MSRVGIVATNEVRYREIARRLIAKEHYTAIAEALGIQISTLYWHMRQPGFRSILREMDERIYAETDQALGDGTLDVTKRIAAMQGEAFDTIVHLMRYGRSERLKKECAMDVLDRGGTTATPKPTTENHIELRSLSVQMLAIAFKESVDSEGIKPDIKTLDDVIEVKDDDAAA